MTTHQMRTFWAALAAAPATGWAHEGHGIDSLSHWHATDTAGLLLVIGVSLAVIWWGRRK